MSQSLGTYIHSTGVGAAVPNMVINPALAWVTNPRMEFVRLTGDGRVIVDTAIASLLNVAATAFMADRDTKTPASSVEQLRAHAGRVHSTTGLCQIDQYCSTGAAAGN